MIVATDHPYFPQTLALHNFVPNEQDLRSVVTRFIIMWITILVSGWHLSVYISPKLRTTERSIVLWFVLCGTLHCFFEGYFVFNHATLAGSQSLFAHLWKEYALSDSRYLSSDPTVLCAEAITMIVWGPMSYATAALILVSSPYRHALQAMISLGHLYGDLLYLSTSLVDLYLRNVSYSRPEPYYFWFYFLFLNLIWVFVPAALLYQSIRAIVEAFASLQQIRGMYEDEKADTIEQRVTQESSETGGSQSIAPLPKGRQRRTTGAGKGQ